MYFKTFSCAAIAEANMGETGFETNEDELQGIFQEDFVPDFDVEPAISETNIEETSLDTNPEEMAGLFEGDIDLGEEGLKKLYSAKPMSQWPSKTVKYYITPRVFDKNERRRIHKGGFQNKIKLFYVN